MIASIDIGKNGVISVYDSEKRSITTIKMPLVKITKEIDIAKLNDIIVKNKIKYIIFEKIKTLPKMSKISYGSIREQVGIVKTIATVNNIRYVVIKPDIWQKHFARYLDDKIKTTSNKEKSLYLCKKLCNIETRDHNVSDSILLLKYAIENRLFDI